jgi:adenine-specific DNA-methyltransferase
MSTQPGDIVLDCFGGSGSTFAVSHKLGRKWIGVEIGSHADSHIIPRLESVFNGFDKAGISKAVNWTGGGAFKYYHLGQSIITIAKDGTGDFNWSLGKKFIEESFLSSYDYVLDKTINLSEGQLFPDEENTPSIGVQAFGTKKRVAVITLNPPGGKNDTLTYEEIFHIYSAIKKNLNPEYINIFTNKGLELAYDSKPEDLDVIKVPHAIFSELEK